MRLIYSFIGASLLANISTAGPLRRRDVEGMRNSPRQESVTGTLGAKEDVSIVPIATSPEQNSASVRPTENTNLGGQSNTLTSSSSPTPKLSDGLTSSGFEVTSTVFPTVSPTLENVLSNTTQAVSTATPASPTSTPESSTAGSSSSILSISTTSVLKSDTTSASTTTSQPIVSDSSTSLSTSTSVSVSTKLESSTDSTTATPSTPSSVISSTLNPSSTVPGTVSPTESSTKTTSSTSFPESSTLVSISVSSTSQGIQSSTSSGILSLTSTLTSGQSVGLSSSTGSNGSASTVLPSSATLPVSSSSSTTPAFSLSRSSSSLSRTTSTSSPVSITTENPSISSSLGSTLSTSQIFSTSGPVVTSSSTKASGTLDSSATSEAPNGTQSPSSTTGAPVVSKITEIPSKLPPPTATSSISPAQATANLEQAKEFNKFFVGILPTTGCEVGMVACIDGKVGNCDGSGKFVMTTCATGERCFAMPMRNVAGVSVGCVNEKRAGQVLGLLDETSAISSPIVVTQTLSPTSTTLTTVPEQSPTTTVGLSSTSITLSQRPPTTAITATATFSDPGEVTTTIPLVTFTPPVATSETEPSATSTPTEIFSSPSTVILEPTTSSAPQPTRGAGDGGLEGGEVTTTIPLQTFTRPPVVTGLPPPPETSQVVEQPTASDSATKTVIPILTTVQVTRTQTPAVETPSSPSEPPAITSNPVPPPIQLPTTIVILQPTPRLGSGDPQPTQAPPANLPPLPDFDFLTIIPMPTLPNGGAPGLVPVTVTETVTKTERIREKETVFVTVRA